MKQFTESFAELWPFLPFPLLPLLNMIANREKARFFVSSVKIKTVKLLIIHPLKLAS